MNYHGVNAVASSKGPRDVLFERRIQAASIHYCATASITSGVRGMLFVVRMVRVVHPALGDSRLRGYEIHSGVLKAMYLKTKHQ